MLGPYISMAMDQEKISDVASLIYLYEILGLPISPLSLLGICMIIIFSIRFGLAIWINKKVLSFCRNVQVDLRSGLMVCYQNMKYEEFIENDSADAISNATVLSMYFTNNVLYMCLRGFSELLLALFIFSFLIFVNGLLVIIFSLGLLILIVSYSRFFKARMISYGETINVANSNLVQAVKQALQGLKEVRVLGKERFFYNRFNLNAKRYADLHAASVLINTGSRYFIEFSVMAFFVVSITASDMLISGDSSAVFSTLGMFAFAAIRLLPGANILSSAILQLRSQKNTVDRLHDTISRLKLDFSSIERSSVKSSADLKKSAFFESIKLKNIRYSYPNSQSSVLTDINLEIYNGESIGIIGSSGSGKTTLIDVLLGLLEPTSGRIILNGEPLQRTINSWRNMTAYIPQESLMINETLAANIQLNDDGYSDDDAQLLRDSISQAQLTRVLENLPEGLATNIGESGIRLSGGQRQRVSIARAIFHSRDVLVFDEATSSLDSETEAQVVNEITRMKGSKTMIIIAHRTETLRFCDRIYRLEKGSIVEVGTPDEILGIVVD